MFQEIVKQRVIKDGIFTCIKGQMFVFYTNNLYSSIYLLITDHCIYYFLYRSDVCI